MEDKYSSRASIILKDAKDLAILHNNPQVTDLHVHLALIQQDHTPIDKIFEEFGIDKDQHIERVKEALSHLDSKPGLKNLYYSRDYQRLILKAKELARGLYNTSIGTFHLFLALFKLEKTTSIYILEKVGFDFQKCYDYIVETSSIYNLNEKYPQGITEVLKQYGSDLTQDAREGKIDPVIGMDDEINRVIQILSRRIKNNPIIVGEPGVGKTAVVEGLAQRIVRQDVPEMLKNKTIFSLRISDVIAGSKLRGEFEEKLQEILEIVANSQRRIIVFIDEIHTVVGTGASSGGMDTSNILKPLLARGEVNVIGATTIAEYSKYIQKDGALERRFQKIHVKEPSVEQTISILRGIKSKYETFHGLKIRDEALVASAHLSERYIGGRRLPDKAIDVLDEACSMVRTEIDIMPLELDELKRKILQLQTEKVLLDEEHASSDTQNRLKKVETKINELSDQFNHEKQIWKSEKMAMKELQHLQEEIEDIERKNEEAKRVDDFEDVANYSHIQLPKLKERVIELLNRPYKYNIIEEVNRNHICEIISKTTGIPVTELSQNEIDRLLNLESIINRKVIGQEQAVKIVSNSILRSRAGIKLPDKPIASYLFIGPTGVGKTYLAKVLADVLYKNRESLIRLDMSEYMEKNSISKLIGSPPGYVGYDEGGQLTEKVALNPYSIILFDEIEKAHQQVFNLLLQMLDEGSLTDSKGRQIDFTNTIIILTSNLGSTELNTSDNGNGAKLSLESVLLSHFNPEFINRLDGIIQFMPLSLKSIHQIVDLYIQELQTLVQDRNIKLSLDKLARDAIVDQSNYQDYGSREVMRIIKNDIETLLAVELLKGQISMNQDIIISIDSNQKFYIK